MRRIAECFISTARIGRCSVYGIYAPRGLMTLDLSPPLVPRETGSLQHLHLPLRLFVGQQPGKTPMSNGQGCCMRLRDRDRPAATIQGLEFTQRGD